MKEVQVKNKEFLSVQEDWKKTKNKKSWERMWFLAYDCCLNTLKKRVGGIRIDLEELATNATILLLNKIKNGTRRNKDWRVKSLPTCCHYAILKVLYSPQLKFEDKVILLSEMIQLRKKTTNKVC